MGPWILNTLAWAVNDGFLMGFVSGIFLMAIVAVSLSIPTLRKYKKSMSSPTNFAYIMNLQNEMVKINIYEYEVIGDILHTFDQNGNLLVAYNWDKWAYVGKDNSGDKVNHAEF